MAMRESEMISEKKTVEYLKWKIEDLELIEKELKAEKVKQEDLIKDFEEKIKKLSEIKVEEKKEVVI